MCWDWSSPIASLQKGPVAEQSSQVKYYNLARIFVDNANAMNPMILPMLHTFPGRKVKSWDVGKPNETPEVFEVFS